MGNFLNKLSQNDIMQHFFESKQVNYTKKLIHKT